ncbi:unnamed protein product [Umbelopsis ramanniana]
MTQSNKREENALVTGFAPFGKHLINPSWEVAKLLSGTTMTTDKKSVLISSLHLPVEYQPVVDIVSPLHREPHQYKYIFHIGVGLDGPVEMETLARNGPYEKPDNLNAIPEGNYTKGPDTLYTKVDVEQIFEWGKREKNWNAEDVRVCADAGLYLCEWTFYLSLRESQEDDTKHATVLFIHVPTIGDGKGQKSLQKMTELVRDIIEGVISHT